MAQTTENFDFYLEDSGETKFKEWRDKINGPNNSNTVKMDDALHKLDITKQDKLTGQPGQVVGFDGMGLAYAVPGWSNQNLLDNWYFVDPVNQRGQNSYSGARIYTIDRWLNENENGTVTIISTGVKFSWNRPDRASYAGFLQYIDTLGLVGKIATLSVVASGTGSCYLFANDSPEGRIKMDLTPEPRLYCLTTMLQPVTWSDWLTFRILADGDGSMAGDITLAAVKLELGPVQTLAHQDADGNWVLNDPPPNKALELALCQKYYCKIQQQNEHLGLCITGMHYGDIQTAVFEIPVPVTMRVSPTIVDIVSLGNIIPPNGLSFPIEGIKVDCAHAGSIRIFINTTNTSTGTWAIDGLKFSFSADL